MYDAVQRSADGKLEVSTAHADFEKAEINQLKKVLKPVSKNIQFSKTQKKRTTYK